MNKTTCITIDVAQDKSQIQGFIGPNKPLCRSRVLRHTKQGFQLICQLIDLVKSKSGINDQPLIIFEFTGIYHKTLEKFLISHHYLYHIVSPLRAAKARKKEMRDQKTDSRDCLSLSKMFYADELGDFYSEDPKYANLRKLNRFYNTNMKHLVKIKVNFKETLAIIYPHYTSVFDNAYSNESLTFLKLFPHPDIFLSYSKEDIIKILCDKWNHKEEWIVSKVSELYDYVSNIISGCYPDDVDASILLSYISQIDYYSNLIDATITQMTNMTRSLPLYNFVYSLPGIKENLTSRFIAELGDINRFTNYKQMIAYTGTDPIIDQSGGDDGLHKKISKKGNKHLRTILNLMVKSMIRANREDNVIRDKYRKWTQQASPLLPGVASIACANQLLKIIFYMYLTGSVYKYKPLNSPK